MASPQPARHRPGADRDRGVEHRRHLRVAPRSPGGDVPPTDAPRFWETSAGNPFFALELGRALQRRGGTLALGEALPIPAALGELLQNRLDELAPSELEVAAFVALLATPTVTLVEAAVGQEAGACLNEALAAKIVELDDERVRFTHPLLGTAVTARLTPARRRSLHARLAEITPNKEEGAHHLARATAEPDESVARFLEEASRVARARGAPREAAELAAEAHRLTPAACRESASRLLNAARLHHEAGDSVRALEFLEQARAESTPGAGRAAALLQLAELRYDLAGPQELLQMLEEALHEAGSDHALAAEAHHTAAMCLRLTGPLAKGLDHANAALRALSDRSHPADECRALATYGLLHFDAGLGVPRKEMERALDLERSLPARGISWRHRSTLIISVGRASTRLPALPYLGIVSEWAHLPDQLDPLFNSRGSNGASETGKPRPAMPTEQSRSCARVGATTWSRSSSCRGRRSRPTLAASTTRGWHVSEVWGERREVLPRSPRTASSSASSSSPQTSIRGLSLT